MNENNNIEDEVIDLVPISPIQAHEFDSQIATAKRFPRSLSKFRKEAEAMATLDEDTAGECLYALPRKGKTIEGPSARLAEILLYAWGNARADAEVVEENDTHIVAMGTFFDLERNVAIRKKVARRITDRHGIRYNDDMVTLTGNAANSIALRNAIFSGIPKALWKPIWMKARKASLGEGGTLTKKRQSMMEWFGKLGVEEARVFDLLGIDGIEDIKEDQLITMRGLANSIKDGEARVEDVFARPGSINGDRSADLNKRVREVAEKESTTSSTFPADVEKKKEKTELIDTRSGPYKMVMKTCHELGISDESQRAWIKEKFGHDSRTKLTLDEFAVFVSWVQSHEIDPPSTIGDCSFRKARQ